ncbi:PGG domain - like 8 [Theobroma cacao]|nr:PGG domain - like 8 [Theobroma cacao]
MKSTAQSGMIVATLITAVVFTTASSVPGGTNGENGTPRDITKTIFHMILYSKEGRNGILPHHIQMGSYASTLGIGIASHDPASKSARSKRLETVIITEKLALSYSYTMMKSSYCISTKIHKDFGLNVNHLSFVITTT